MTLFVYDKIFLYILNQQKMKIGVFFGSRTPEHDVSIITGELIINGLKELGHEVIPVYISKKGAWYSEDELGKIEFFKEKNYEDRLNEYKVQLDLGVTKVMRLKKTGFLSSKTIDIELAFPAIHGQNGEDGTIQGLFELLNIPYVGCGVASSAIAMDKILTKQLYSTNNIPTTKFLHFSKNNWSTKREEIVKEINSKLKYPLFVKPPRLGSSIGISKVEGENDLEFAIEVALHYDLDVLVEEGVSNLKDITIAVMGNNDPIVSEIQQSSFSDQFFSYEEKYINEGGAQLGNAQKKIIIPAELDKKTTDEIKVLAKEIYLSANCSGIARIDFLFDSKEMKYFANEINTLPGTLYHHLWKESGVGLKELLNNLIEFASEKYEEKNKLTSTFDSDILKKSNSQKLSQKLG